jgi:hypothetical protein
MVASGPFRIAWKLVFLFLWASYTMVLLLPLVEADTGFS